MRWIPKPITRTEKLGLACVWVLLGTSIGRTVPTTSAPAASQPAEEIVLVKIADRAVITQADFNSEMSKVGPGNYPVRAERAIRTLLEERWLQLYTDDHPELVQAEDLERKIAHAKKTMKINTDAELEERLRRAGSDMKQFRQHYRLGLAKAALMTQGEKRAEDETYLRSRFNSTPDEFNGSSISLKHILASVWPTDTPEQRLTKRQKMDKLRQDLMDKKLTWTEAVKQSDCPSRFVDGDLGSSTRHFIISEQLIEQAIKLDVNQLSEVLETPLGYHLVIVTAKQPGKRTFEQSRKEVRRWVILEPYLNVINDAWRKYPVVGVRAPDMPPNFKATSAPAHSPAQSAPSSRPSSS